MDVNRRGNSLAVFPNASGRTAAQMQRVTQELRHFETVFFEPTTQASTVRARVFDLFEELPFAAHPLIAVTAENSLRTFIALLFLTTISSTVVAQSPSVTAALNPLLGQLHASTAAEPYQQIIGAVSAATALRMQLNDLAASGSVTEMKVVPESDLPSGKGKIFHRFTDGTRLLFSSEFLQALQKKTGCSIRGVLPRAPEW
jgi:PhzF family phenazine biosynthesis protein